MWRVFEHVMPFRRTAPRAERRVSCAHGSARRVVRRRPAGPPCGGQSARQGYGLAYGSTSRLLSPYSSCPAAETQAASVLLELEPERKKPADCESRAFACDLDGLSIRLSPAARPIKSELTAR